MIAAPPCPAPPPLLAWASPSLFAPSKPLSQHRQLAWAANKNLSYNQTPRAFPRLSLSIPPRRNNEFLKQQQQQLQQLCLSAFSPPPHIKTNNNNKPQFLTLALPNSNYDDNSHIKQQQEEEKPTASSALQIQQKVPPKISPYLKLVTGLGLAAQLFCSHIALAFIDLLSSPTERRIHLVLLVCTIMSMLDALRRYAFVAEEHAKIFNGPSKLSPRCDGESLKKHFCDGMLCNLLGTCLAILVMRNRCYALKRFQELGCTKFVSILKSFTPRSLVVALEMWPFQVSAFFLLSHLLGLACSLYCYDQTDPINPQDVAKPLFRMGIILLLSGMIIG